MLKNIAFYSNVPQCGKSTSAKYLVENYKYTLLGLAKPFKDMLEVLFRHYGFSEKRIERMMYGDLKEEIIPEIGKSPRELMVTIGTDWGVKMVNPLIWCYPTLINVPSYPLVLEDMRQPHEYNFYKDFIKVKIVRDSGFEVKYCSDGLLKDYEFDYIIDNNSSFEDLYMKLDVIAVQSGLDSLLEKGV
jgi:hypothetical protein